MVADSVVTFEVESELAKVVDAMFSDDDEVDDDDDVDDDEVDELILDEVSFNLVSYKKNKLKLMKFTLKLLLSLTTP